MKPMPDWTYALLSDIHGNLEALEAVLDDLAEVGNPRILVLGDVINYGPNPRECLERVTEVAELVLIGNHEREAVDATDHMESDVRALLAWTLTELQDCPAWQALAARIRDEGYAALAHRRLDGIELVHATPRRPVDQYLWPGHETQYLALNREMDARMCELLDEFSERHGFCGHTHVPAVLTAYDSQDLFDPLRCTANRHGTFTFVGPQSIFFVPDGPGLLRGLAELKVVINPGSVGQSRTLGDPAASYALYDGDRLSFRRVAYDAWRTAAKIRELPIDDGEKERLVRRLGTGV